MHRTLVSSTLSVAIAAAAVGAPTAGRSSALAPGDLDPTFRGGVVALPWGSHEEVTAVVLSGRKVVVAGSYDDRLRDPGMIARYSSAGRPDRPFGSRGVARVRVHDGEVSLSDVAMTPNGGYAVAGTSLTGAREPGAGALVARLSRHGRLVRSFGRRGVIQRTFGTQQARAEAVVALPDGDVAVCGLVEPDPTRQLMVVARFTRTGALDPTFNGTGIVIDDRPFDDLTTCLELTATDDGGLLILGGARPNWDDAPELTEAFVMRLDAAGQLVAAFGTSGGVIDLGRGEHLFPRSDLVLLDDGSMVFSGSRWDEATDRTVGFVVKLDDMGRPDPGFGGGDAVVEIALPGRSTVLADVSASPGGRLVAVGRSIPDAGPRLPRALVVRLLANGSLDPSFADGGVLVRRLGAARSGLVDGAVRPDGRIVAVGHVRGSQGVIARLQG